MKNLVLTAFVAVLFTVQLTFTQKAAAQTSGQVTFTFKTVTQNGTYAPKHVLAAWIEKDGVFVKTRLVRANQRKQYLYTWKASSNSNEVDAITGSTLTSHQTMTVEWNCQDLDGNVVPDGEYVLWVEFTEKHAQAVHLTPLNQANYIDMVFDYIPDGVGIDNQNDHENLTVFPNPSSGVFQLQNTDNKNLQVVVYSLSGKEILRTVVSPQTNNQIDLSSFGKGNYLLRIADEDGTQVVRVAVM